MPNARRTEPGGSRSGAGLALPEREAMSKIGIGVGSGIDNFAMPINEATAMNIASIDSSPSPTPTRS